jgi:hypothetical protein
MRKGVLRYWIAVALIPMLVALTPILDATYRVGGGSTSGSSTRASDSIQVTLLNLSDLRVAHDHNPKAFG